MAPEPEATIAIREETSFYPEWVIDGFPRSARQLRVIRFPTIIFLTVSARRAVERLQGRGRQPMAVELYRVREQSRLLAPVRAMAAVEINTTWRTPEEVLQATIDWLELEKQPRMTVGNI